MRQQTAIFSTILLSFSAASQQLPPIEIGQVGRKSVAISASALNHGVGNSVLMRVHLLGQPSRIGSRDILGESYVLLVACDGSWISTPVQSTFQLAEVNNSFSDLESYAKSFEVTAPLDMAIFEKPLNSELDFALLVSKKAISFCKTAAREPRNFVIPVGLSKTTAEVYSSYGIVLGTQSYDKGLIDIWTKTTDYIFADLVDENGKPFEVNGVIRKRKELTGHYIMRRGIYDCKSRSVATYETIVYDPKISAPESISTPKDKAIQTSIVPNSVGEAQLEAICRLYSRLKLPMQ